MCQYTWIKFVILIFAPLDNNSSTRTIEGKHASLG